MKTTGRVVQNREQHSELVVFRAPCCHAGFTQSLQAPLFSLKLPMLKDMQSSPFRSQTAICTCFSWHRRCGSCTEATKGLWIVCQSGYQVLSRFGFGRGRFGGRFRGSSAPSPNRPAHHRHQWKNAQKNATNSRGKGRWWTQAAAEDAELQSETGWRHRAQTADSAQQRRAATLASSFCRSVISTSSMRRSFCAHVQTGHVS